MPPALSAGPKVPEAGHGRDTQDVATADQHRAMNILLDCPCCQEEVLFEVDQTDEDLVCHGCNTRMAFAPDPVTTFSLLYERAKAA